MEKVGIKLADGKFYPILDKYGSLGKNLVLTTVSDGQSLAQIDFYLAGNTAEEQYAGTLVVDGLSQKYAGETSIDLKIWPSGDGRIFAEAYEIDGTGSAQKLEIDIASLDMEKLDADRFDMGGGWSSGVKVAAKRRFNPIVPMVIAAIIFLAVALGFLFLFLSQGLSLRENVYAEPQVREEPVIAQPPVLDDRANMPEPPSIPGGRDFGNTPESATVVPNPNAFRKALRTELEQ